AARPAYYYNKIGVGRAWTTTSSIALPASLTVECLFRPDMIPFPECALVSTRPATDNRGYYLWLNGSNLNTRVGTGNAATIQIVQAGRWYYAACTYTRNGSSTTVNGYCADLSADGPLQHVVTNLVMAGNYGGSGILGIGCMRNVPVQNILEYFAPCTIDEVALYNTAHSYETLSNRMEKLRLPPPKVGYREIFPNDASLADRAFPAEGWKVHRGAGAVAESSVVIAEYFTAFGDELTGVASFPGENGVSEGYLNNHAGATDNHYLYWTEEMTDRIDLGWLKRLDFDVRAETNYTLRVALRVDTGSTPAPRNDGAWFVSSDFLRPAGTSVFNIPATYGIRWIRCCLDIGASEWAGLSFEPGQMLAIGAAPVTLPANGVVTAFGVFQDAHFNKKNLRIDNYTLHAIRVCPPQKGTLVMFT
ncbi:MAG: hypothetical protein PHU80_10450, partial [Kiritimatiellae bacterium]|nr:hypothetical protein [Kiritimatiellia bacterium]